MNKIRQTVLLLGGIATLLMASFPPYTVMSGSAVESGTATGNGFPIFAPVWSPPELADAAAQIDTHLLTAELVVAIVVIGAGLMLANRFPDK